MTLIVTTLALIVALVGCETTKCDCPATVAALELRSAEATSSSTIVLSIEDVDSESLDYGYILYWINSSALEINDSVSRLPLDLVAENDNVTYTLENNLYTNIEVLHRGLLADTTYTYRIANSNNEYDDDHQSARTLLANSTPTMINTVAALELRSAEATSSSTIVLSIEDVDSESLDYGYILYWINSSALELNDSVSRLPLDLVAENDNVTYTLENNLYTNIEVLHRGLLADTTYTYRIANSNNEYDDDHQSARTLLANSTPKMININQSLNPFKNK